MTEVTRDNSKTQNTKKDVRNRLSSSMRKRRK